MPLAPALRGGAGGSKVQGYTWLHSESAASLGSVRHDAEVLKGQVGAGLWGGRGWVKTAGEAPDSLLSDHSPAPES